MWNREQVVHVLIFEKICGLSSPISETANCVWSWRERWALRSAVSSLVVVAVIQMLWPFNLFISASFELWVYWHAKGKKKKERKYHHHQTTKKPQTQTKQLKTKEKKIQAYVLLLNQPFLNPHSVISVSHYGIITIWVWDAVCRKISIFSWRNTTVPERRRKKEKKEENL